MSAVLTAAAERPVVECSSCEIPFAPVSSVGEAAYLRGVHNALQHGQVYPVAEPVEVIDLTENVVELADDVDADDDADGWD